MRVASTFWLLGAVLSGTFMHICFNVSFQFPWVPSIQTYAGVDVLGHMVIVFNCLRKLIGILMFPSGAVSPHISVLCGAGMRIYGWGQIALGLDISDPPAV